MARTTKDETRQKLRHAVVAEAVEKGFGAVSVAGVVARANVSAGTVYVHFENKDQMLRDIYMEIKTEFHTTLMRDDKNGQGAQNSKTKIRNMWFDMFEFLSHSPLDLLFLEYGNAAKILTRAQQGVVDGFAKDIADILRAAVNDGTLAPLDPKILSLLLLAPAMQMSRGAALRGETIAQSTIQNTFDRVWLSIENNTSK